VFNRNLLTPMVVVVLAFGVGGCPTDPPGDPNDMMVDEVSFAADIAPVFQSRCAGCHQPDGFASQSGIDVDLRTEAPFEGLFADAMSAAGRKLIVPGDPDASFLFEKVSQTDPSAGERMPLFGAPLSDEQIELLRDWIAAGAPQN